MDKLLSLCCKTNTGFGVVQIYGGLPGFAFSGSLPNMFSDALIGAVSLAFIVSTFPEGENMKLLRKKMAQWSASIEQTYICVRKKKKTVQGKLWIQFIKK